MAQLRRQRSERNIRTDIVEPCISIKWRIFSVVCLIFGPLFLLYLTLRCEKNQCVLFQLPLVIPTHASAYFSTFATSIVLGFLTLMLLFNITARPATLKTSGKGKEQPVMSAAFSSLLSTTLLLLALYYLKPEYIKLAHDEYLRMLAAVIVISIIISTLIFLFSQIGILKKDRDHCCPMAFFYGSTTEIKISHVELKYFFYVYVGLVAWALLDLLILLNYTIDHAITAPLAFLTGTHFCVIAHTLAYEQFLRNRPFVKTEGLGFFWLMRVFMYLPFLHSLPVYYAATTEMSLPKPAILADSVLFLFGFVIYISSIHQKENFAQGHTVYKNIKSIPASQGKKILISGYWGIVQKPDYLGYMIIWLSWTIACGFGGVPVVVLIVVIGTILMWLRQSANYKRNSLGNGWTKYCTNVPKQIIPFVY